MVPDERKKWLLYCVKSALQSSSVDIREGKIHESHLAWMLLLILWWHKGKQQSSSKKFFLDAMIVFYLVYTLLEQYDQPGNNN